MQISTASSATSESAAYIYAAQSDSGERAGTDGIPLRSPSLTGGRGKTLPLRCVSTAFAAKTMPLLAVLRPAADPNLWDRNAAVQLPGNARVHEPVCGRAAPTSAAEQGDHSRPAAASVPCGHRCFSIQPACCRPLPRMVCVEPCRPSPAHRIAAIVPQYFYAGCAERSCQPTAVGARRPARGTTTRRCTACSSEGCLLPARTCRYRPVSVDLQSKVKERQ